MIRAMKEQKSGTRATGTITISRAEYEELKSQNEWLLEQLRLANKKRFGASSEQTKEQLDGQLSLTFNEAEAYAAPPGPKKVAQVAAHTRKQSGSVKDVAPEDIPVEVIEHRLSEEERACPQCGEEMREIGTEVRETLVLIPAKAGAEPADHEQLGAAGGGGLAGAGVRCAAPAAGTA